MSEIITLLLGLVQFEGEMLITVGAWLIIEYGYNFWRNVKTSNAKASVID